ncbi:hypothetical protein SEA_ROMAN_92 [Microbacterium phage Roman]|nr:hypothetical protein LUPINE_90 [Microbacterium phage Lupine]QDK03333.1 hypothetical protein SEA_ROMAN_92 [Microbacterium phage Roman]
MSERGMMQVEENGKRVDLIPFVGVKPKAMASALSRLISKHVYYVKHEGGDRVA